MDEAARPSGRAECADCSVDLTLVAGATDESPGRCPKCGSTRRSAIVFPGVATAPGNAWSPEGVATDITSTPTEEGWSCDATVRDGGETQHHRVRVSRAELARLAPGAADPEDLVRASFGFLLEREPKESILGAFDLSVIGRYFAGYEREIVRRIRVDRTG